MPNSISKTGTKKVIFITSTLTLLIVIILLAILNQLNIIDIYHQASQSKKVVTVGTPVAPPRNKSVNASQATKTNTNNNLSDNGSITNTQGTATIQTGSSQWTTSASGLITVKSPTANSQLTNGSVLAGSSKTSQINYRLIDNVIGVIDEGYLNVVNGNFSGTLHFNPHGTGGRLDVFTTNSQGVEYNEVQINVTF